MKFLIIAALLALFVVIIVKSRKGKGEEESKPLHSAEYLNYYNSVYRMSYAQLSKMHDDLIPLVTKTLIGGLVYYDDDLSYDEQKQMEQNINSKYVTIPEKDRIYGCVTYDEASMLNQLIVKRIDELDNWKRRTECFQN